MRTGFAGLADERLEHGRNNGQQVKLAAVCLNECQPIEVDARHMSIAPWSVHRSAMMGWAKRDYFKVACALTRSGCFANVVQFWRRSMVAINKAGNAAQL